MTTTQPANPGPTPSGPSGQPDSTSARPTNRLRDLHPGWTASVMGTAILAVTTWNNPGNVDALADLAHAVAVALAVLAYALAAVLTVAYAARWTVHRDAAMTDLRNPMLGALHATWPGALLVLAVMTATIGPDLLGQPGATALVAVLAVVGGSLALLLGVAFGYELVVGEIPAAAPNGAWFIPPVVTIIVPMVVVPLIPHVGAQAGTLLLFLGYASLGMGLLLFVFLMAVLLNRLVLHPKPPAPMAPAMWVGLGPVALSALSPMTLASAGPALFGDAAPGVALGSRLFGTAMWGFGVWWLALVVALLVGYLRRGSIPFHLGWWAFVFPLGAYTMATLVLARSWQLDAIEALGAGLWTALAGAWGIVTVRTLAGIRSGSVWRR